MNAQLHPNDLHHVVSRIPRDLRKAMMETGLVLGGGFIRETVAGQAANDCDIFGPDQGAMHIVAQGIANERAGRLVSTQNAYTVVANGRLPIQFITRWLYSSAGEVIESFDFTVCQAAVWFDRKDRQWASAIGEGFYRDLAARRLVYTFPQRNEDAGGSMLRARKFLSRGYSIQPQSLAGVVSRLAMAIDWEAIDRNVTTDRSEDRERRVAKVITALLREVDPSLVVDGVDLIDEYAADPENPAPPN